MWPHVENLKWSSRFSRAPLAPPPASLPANGPSEWIGYGFPASTSPQINSPLRPPIFLSNKHGCGWRNPSGCLHWRWQQTWQTSASAFTLSALRRWCFIINEKTKTHVFYVLIISISYSTLHLHFLISQEYKDIHFQNNNIQRTRTKVNAQFLYCGLTRLSHVPVTKDAILVFEVLLVANPILFHVMCPKNQKRQAESKN